MSITDGSAVRVRTPWHETGRGCWSLSLALGGYTVRVTQRKPGAVFERIIVLGGAQDWQSLETTDRVLAESRTRAFLQALVADQEAEPADGPAMDPEVRQEQEPAAAGRPPTMPQAESMPPVALPETENSPPGQPPLTLGRLWTLYEESASFARLDNSTRHGYRSAARILLASMGADTDVTKLDKEAVTAHRNRRAAGGIRYWRVKHNRHGQVMKDASGKEILVEVTTPPVRARAVGLDLQVLRVVLNWAVETRGPDGEFLLDHFPIRGGIEIPREQNPVRPFADYERFCLLLQAVQRAAETAEAGGDALAARRFRLLELALVLVEATGRRIGSVRQLRRTDFELNEANGFANARIRWRWASDKKRRQGSVPIPRELAAVLHGLLARLGVVGEAYVFAQRHTPSKPVSRDELSKWALEAEEAAQLPHLEGGLWHPFRRKWSKERKHLPEIKDVMAAGGWTDIKTFMDSYNEPDFDTMLAVMEAPVKARAEAAAKAAAAAAAVRPSEAIERVGGACAPSVRKSEATAHSGVRRRPANRPAVANSAVERNDARPAHLRLV